VLRIEEPTLLLLYTDGLVESRKEDIDVGILRPADLFRGAEGTPQQMCGELLRGAGPQLPADDRTLLLARLTPAGH
jgi:hypothetical protein